MHRLKITTYGRSFIKKKYVIHRGEGGSDQKFKNCGCRLCKIKGSKVSGHFFMDDLPEVASYFLPWL